MAKAALTCAVMGSVGFSAQGPLKLRRRSSLVWHTSLRSKLKLGLSYV
jgi:hypothetical protein